MSSQLLATPSIHSVSKSSFCFQREKSETHDFRWVGNKLWTLSTRKAREGTLFHLSPATPVNGLLQEFEFKDHEDEDRPGGFGKLLISALDHDHAAMAGVNFLGATKCGNQVEVYVRSLGEPVWRRFCLRLSFEFVSPDGLPAAPRQLSPKREPSSPFVEHTDRLKNFLSSLFDQVFAVRSILDHCLSMAGAAGEYSARNAASALETAVGFFDSLNEACGDHPLRGAHFTDEALSALEQSVLTAANEASRAAYNEQDVIKSYDAAEVELLRLYQFLVEFRDCHDVIERNRR